jgi:hypothetical protein
MIDDPSSTTPVAGGLYSTARDTNGNFGVVKVLVVDDEAVHVRLYAESWPDRPASVDPDALTLGQLKRLPDGTWGPPDGPMGIGHLPISHANFAAWQPRLIATYPVSDDELDGYKDWKEAGGGVWA